MRGFFLLFLLTTSALYQKIRNIQIRLLQQDALLATEVSKYDQKVVLEALHNCIAHQDYTKGGRIVVVEQPNRLIFENQGTFFEGTPDAYVEGQIVPTRYRNPFLANAMVELNMIDTMGYGIFHMHKLQASRYLPMPDYDLTNPEVVRLTIHGGVVDPAYSRLLIQKTNLPLSDILALDRIQKKLPVPDDKVRKLRQQGLIEGRKPNLHVSLLVARATGKMGDYIRTRVPDEDFFIKIILDYVTESGGASRTDIDHLIVDKLSEALTLEQKRRKVSNLLTKMRRQQWIQNIGSRSKPTWVIAERSKEKNNKNAIFVC